MFGRKRGDRHLAISLDEGEEKGSKSSIFVFNNNTNKFSSTREYNVIQYITYNTAYLH